MRNPVVGRTATLRLCVGGTQASWGDSMRQYPGANQTAFETHFVKTPWARRQRLP